MDKIGIPYRSDTPDYSGVLGDGNLMYDAMMYSANASSSTLRYAKGIKVKSGLQLF